MKRFGIDTTLAIGISVTDLRKFSRKIGRDHELALSLWNTTIHEARMLAALIDDPKQLVNSKWTPGLRMFTLGIFVIIVAILFLIKLNLLVKK